MGNRKGMLILMYVTIFTASFGFIMYSALVTAFSETYRISLAEAGIVGSVLCAGQLIVIFINDRLAKYFSKPLLMAIGTAAHVISMFQIAWAPSFPVLLTAFFINGAAISLLNVVMSAYISDIFGEKRNSYLNIFHGIYGIGSLTGPILPTVILAAGFSWKKSYIFVGIFSILLLAAILWEVRKERKTVREQERDKETLRQVSFYRLLKDPVVFMVCLACMVFMGFDMMISTYMAGYLGLAMNAAKIAGLTITFYWLGSAAGRLIYPILFAKYDTRKYLMIVDLITALLLLGAMAVRDQWVMMGLITLVGFLSGVNFPLEIGMVCEIYPEYSAGATNAVSIFGSLGGIIFSALGGWLMENAGYGSLLLLGSILMVCIVGLLSGVVYRERRTKRNV